MALSTCQSQAVLYDAIMAVDSTNAATRTLCPYAQKNPCASSDRKDSFLQVTVGQLGFSHAQKNSLCDNVKATANSLYNTDTFLQRVLLEDNDNTMNDLSADIQNNS